MQQNHLDEFDLKILDILQRDANLTNAQLAEMVNLSPSQCSRRRSSLEDAGYIEGYSARLNTRKLGYEIQAITRINLSAHSEEIAKNFAEIIQAWSEIQAAYSVSGDADYVLHIRTHNLQQFAEFVHRKLLPLTHVAQVRSEIVLMSLKENGGLPINATSAMSE